MITIFEERQYEIEYAIKHLTEPTRFFNLMYLWDMTSTTESDGDGLSLRQHITHKGNKYVWDIPRKDYFTVMTTGMASF